MKANAPANLPKSPPTTARAGGFVVWVVAHRGLLALTGLVVALVVLAGWGLSGAGAPRETKIAMPAHSPPPGVAWLGEGRADLGEFDVPVFLPTDSGLRVRFHAMAETTLADADALDRLMRARGRTVRAEIDTVIRAASREELFQGDPLVLGRKMTARVNRELGSPVLTAMELHDYAVYEP